MRILCRCKSCQKKFKVDAKMAGRRFRCTNCDCEIVVPPMATALDEDSDESGSLLDISAAIRAESSSPTPRPGSTTKLRAPASGGSSPKQAAAAPKPKSQNPLIIGIVLGVLLVGIAVLFGISMAKQPLLLLDWPVAERTDASLTVDQQEIPLTGEMPLRVILPPGKHRVVIRRRGYLPVEWKLNLGRGEEKSLKPEWEAMPNLNFN